MSGPVNVGTSLFALKYKDGVMLAGDTGISYGGMLKHKDGKRMCKVSDETIIGCSGEMADFQNLEKMLQEKCEADLIEEDGASFYHPRDYFNYISRHQYQKRLKSDPVWVSCITAGINKLNGEVFLGTSNFHGTKVEANYLLTGLGMHYCQVLMQNSWRADMTEAEARTLIEDCMKVMFYRDKKAHDKVQIATVTFQGGVQIGEAYRVEASSNLQSYYD